MPSAGRHEPDVSVVGIVLTALSVVVMQWLAHAKRRVGIAMESKAVQADSSQTSACVYLSIVVLGGLLLNAAFGWWWADPLAALGVVVFLVREGRDASHRQTTPTTAANSVGCRRVPPPPVTAMRQRRWVVRRRDDR